MVLILLHSVLLLPLLLPPVLLLYCVKFSYTVDNMQAETENKPAGNTAADEEGEAAGSTIGAASNSSFMQQCAPLTHWIGTLLHHMSTVWKSRLRTNLLAELLLMERDETEGASLVLSAIFQFHAALKCYAAAPHVNNMEVKVERKPAGGAAADREGRDRRGVVGAAAGLGRSHGRPGSRGGLAGLAWNVCAAHPLALQQQGFLIAQPACTMKAIRDLFSTRLSCCAA